ncbi:hypothetical protein F5884DRAFT_883663 [Xylogone sp. PMI_703]|nr:hypothetical protein F5884DRAFT_883663 [Xylogone sp. PMI_703]
MNLNSSVSWIRLVRYNSVPGGIAKYGEPIADQKETDIDRLAREGILRVRVCQGEDPLCLNITEVVETVNQLFGPLEAKNVPIIRCIGLNYKSHILETGRALPTYPTMFTKSSLAVADHNEAIPVPKIAQEQCDYEGELVVMIGRDGKNISEADALDYVAAYTVGNDISSRDWQRDVAKAGPIPQWSFSKSFDKYAPLGPCLVSKTELGEADKLSLRTLVNGEVRQQANTSDLWFGVRRLISFCSQGQTLQKGSLIMTGTPGGVGLFMRPPTFLKHGDEVCVEIDRIGTLRNIITFE